MADWKPRVSSAIDLGTLRLSPLEGYLLSRMDGVTDLGQLAELSGLTGGELRPLLDRLVAAGAVERPPGLEEGGTHRRLFEARLHALPEDARERLASVAEEPELSALCYDPAPRVVRRVLENPRAGLAHARLIAGHHGNAAGLEALASRAAFLRDGEVARLLLRNNQSPGHVVERLLGARRLHEVYNVCQSRDSCDRARQVARELLRRRFATASPEERVELILLTEGRVLSTLSGASLDGRAAALLCARPLPSALLIESLGRWPATPPPVLAHLLKQPIVRQTPQLRALLKRHPNCPPLP